MVAPAPGFVGDDGIPSWRAFRPTKGDLERTPPGVSVWDFDRVTVEQVRAFLPPKGHLSYRFTDTDVRDASAAWLMPGVRVVREPVTEQPQAALPGAMAHCELEGLDWRKPSETEKQWQARLAFLSGRLVTTD
jgi:hypothetical protein